ncbi:MAG: universal stress protein [Chloroflexota bacterium]
MELHRILVPLDGSDLAEHALPLAEQLARESGAELIVARAPLARAIAGLDAVEANDAAASAIAEVNAYLTDVRARLATHGTRARTAAPSPPGGHGAVDVSHVVRPIFPFRQIADVSRDAAEAMVTEAAQSAADLIVMATHGRSGLGRWLFGSAALDVLKRTTTPLLLVRPAASDVLPRGEEFKILVALDGSHRAEAVIPAAAALANLLGGSLVLTQAVPALRRHGVGWLVGPHVIDQAEHDLLVTQANDYLADVVARLGDSVRTSAVVAEGDAAVAIGRTKRAQNCALVAMTTHGRTGLLRLTLGSVAEAIMSASSAPVLIVRCVEFEQSDLEAAVVGETHEPVLTVELTERQRQVLLDLLRSAGQSEFPPDPELVAAIAERLVAAHQ